MVEPDGDILLDGQLTRDMGLHQLRRSISIIPQESLLFSESLRINLDPFCLYSDEVMWNVLEKVELKAYVSAQVCVELIYKISYDNYDFDMLIRLTRILAEGRRV